METRTKPMQWIPIEDFEKEEWYRREKTIALLAHWESAARFTSCEVWQYSGGNWISIPDQVLAGFAPTHVCILYNPDGTRVDELRDPCPET